MIRSELVDRLARSNAHLTRRESERIVHAVLEAIAAALAEGRRVELRGFGAFSTRPREGRAGRNPRTGDQVAVASKRVAHFKAGKEIRARLNVGDDDLGAGKIAASPSSSRLPDREPRPQV